MAGARLNDSAALVEAVRRDLFQANADDNWPDEKILAIADDCLRGPIASALKRTKQDWFAHDFDVTMFESQSNYDIPSRAMWGSMENAYLVDKTSGRIVSQLANISESQRPIFQPGNDGLSGTPTAVWMGDTEFFLTPAPDANAVSSYSLTVAAYIRPGELCKTDQVVRVKSVVSSSSMTVLIGQYGSEALADIPSSWDDFPYDNSVAYRLDVYGSVDPHSVKLISVCGSLTAPSTLCFLQSVTGLPMSADQFALLTTGRYITTVRKTPFVRLPYEATPYLRRMIQKSILTSQTDPQGLQAYLADEANALALFIKGMSNRHDGKPRKISLAYAAGARFMRRR